MSRLAHLVRALPPGNQERDPGSVRKTLRAVEHEDLDLPLDLLAADGKLDIYPDVEALLEVRYNRKRQRFVVRSSGWVGQIPLNAAHSLHVDTRVPVANLERIIAQAVTKRGMKVLLSHERRYGDAQDRPTSILDVLADSFLDTLSELMRDGLLKAYVARERESSSPVGRLDPYRSMIRTQQIGRPAAVSSAFERTIDCAANRILLLAVCRLQRHYSGINPFQRTRLRKLAVVEAIFQGVGTASTIEISSEELGLQLRRLPVHRPAYAAALSLAGYLVADLGFDILELSGLAAAPSILVKMDEIFEDYARGVLSSRLEPASTVLDGNKGGLGGAIEPLFTDLAAGQHSQADAKPDIVIKVAGEVRLIIDAKYMPAPPVPGRDVINQLACYAARYGCDRVMALYPSNPTDRTASVERIGSIGRLQLYRGSLDLGADDLTSSEIKFCRDIDAIVSSPTVSDN